MAMQKSTTMTMSRSFRKYTRGQMASDGEEDSYAAGAVDRGTYVDVVALSACVSLVLVAETRTVGAAVVHAGTSVEGTADEVEDGLSVAVWVVEVVVMPVGGTAVVLLVVVVTNIVDVATGRPVVDERAQYGSQTQALTFVIPCGEVKPSGQRVHVSFP